MTLEVATAQGKVRVSLESDFQINKQVKQKIESSIRLVFSEEAKPIASLIAKLKQQDPLMGTPRGSLLAFKTMRGWTQLELAKRSGINQGDLSKMIHGKLPIGLSAAKKLAKAFNLKGEGYKKFL